MSRTCLPVVHGGVRLVHVEEGGSAMGMAMATEDRGGMGFLSACAI